VILLMHYNALGEVKALQLAKERRKVITPIGSFPGLLKRLDRLPRDSAGRFELSLQPALRPAASTTLPRSKPEGSPTGTNAIPQCKLKPGDRVKTIKRLCGTVKFVGMLPSTTGVFVGIHLDDQKGRNDGDYKGQTYFSCLPGHGIFVRPEACEVY